ncbi:MAG: DUF3794 domain-containing protein [Ruminococcus sp.]|nr:DUF3794 domain-containing protein [Ruminococcus sp.]
MSCDKKGCNASLKRFGSYNLSRIKINGADRTQLNWNEISIPEIVSVPTEKPDIEQLDQVYVDANINCAKLIETPYSYKTYERLATALEITTATTAINLAVVDITPIIDAVDAILAIPLLPAIPEVTALQTALTAVTSAATALTTTITNALDLLGGTCVPASLVVTLLTEVSNAVKLLQTTLTSLIAAANALAAVVASIPVVGPAVAAAVEALLTAVDAVVQLLLSAVEAILNAITLIGTTTYFALTPNEEGTCLTGRKLIIEGVLRQKVVYTGLVETQSVHSMHNEIPFTAYIIPYAKFDGLTYEENITVIDSSVTGSCQTITINGFAYDPANPPVVDTCEEFCVSSYVEDIFAYAMDNRTVFKNITLFLSAKPTATCI